MNKLYLCPVNPHSGSGQLDNSQWDRSTRRYYLVNQMDLETKHCSLPFSGQPDKGV
ncbi:hypothetical protein TIFTF001_016778 [Ficus carica]|uniref:Uncharacterized protein n=1 Tax=Ficus carica TaxID=3494 RepID=A0AA88DA47_FICCA|nr:hypothetical protein TIFTF001_016778 [Ficus carica]